MERPSRSLIGPALGAAAALVAAAAGCASAPPAPPPLEIPGAEVAVRAFAGDVLGGTSGPAPAPGGGAARALAVEVTLFALDRLPATWLAPLSEEARLVAGADGAEAVLPSPERLRGARAGRASDPGRLVADLEGGRFARAAPIAVTQAALPRGVTVAFDLTRGRRRLSILIHRGRDRLEAALDLDGETALLSDRRDREREALAFAVPSPYGVRGVGALAAVVAVAPPPAAGPGRAAHDAAFARCMAALGGPPAAVAPPPPEAIALVAALRAFEWPDARRRALVVLATAEGAEIAGDLAFAGDEPILVSLTATVARDGPAAVTRGGRALGWALERAALASVAPVLDPGPAPPEVLSVLLRRTGGLALRPAALIEVAEAAAGLEDFKARLRRANRDLLADSSPAVRARAAAWLASHGGAPPGYDPLGPAAARRAALRREEER